MRPFCYGRESLFALKKCVKHKTNYSLNSSTWAKLKELNIAKKTLRGCRGGKNKPRPIGVRITDRIEQSMLSTQKSNTQNLVEICLQKNCSNKGKVLQSRLVVWNSQSMMNKAADICDLIIHHNVDILVITEAWFKGNELDHVVLADIDHTLQDFDFHQLPRAGGKSGGGICVILRKGYNVQTKIFNFESFECLQLTISDGPGDSLDLFAIYRSGAKRATNNFFEDFSSLLESVALTSGQIVVSGDFNIHFDVADDYNTRKLLDLLESADLVQHIKEPTHRSGHTLDLLITSKLQDCVSNVYPVVRDLPSDHYALKCDILIQRPKATKQVVKSRDLHTIDKGKFRNDLKESLTCSNKTDNDSVNNMAEQYNNVLSNLLNEHAPEKSREISLRPKAPWYTDSLRDMKRKKRSLERRWKKTELTVDKEVFREECIKYKQALTEAKSEYHRSQIAECDSRQLFRLVNKLSVYKPSKALPSYDSKKTLANRFSKFFDEKIRKICFALDLSASTQSHSSVSVQRDCKSRFSTFKAVSSKEILKIVNRSAVKTCQLDPLPASLTKLCLEDLIPSITAIVNSSLKRGVFPDCLKQALVCPLLKKASLDAEEFKNYRPVSNLPFLGKVIERVAIDQLQSYVTDNALFAKNQSAYRLFHSTETALVRVNNDLLKAVDEHQEAVWYS